MLQPIAPDLRRPLTLPVTIALTIAFSIASAPRALAHGVRVVDAAGDRVFPSIAAAVQGAEPGDTLIVAEGTYGSVEIDKPVRIFAAPGHDVAILGWLAIRDVDEGWVSVQGIRFEPVNRMWEDAITVEGCSAAVRIAHCTVPEPAAEGGGGVRVAASTDVVLQECSVVGSRGRNCNEATYPSSGSGGPGLVVAAGSSVALFDCEFEGGPYDFCSQTGGPGGAVIVDDGSFLFASGSVFRGFGAYYYSWGLWALGDSVVETVDTMVLGEDYIDFGATWNPLSGPARSFRAAGVVLDDQPLIAEVSGRPGDRLRFLASDVADFQYRRPLRAPWLQPPLQFLPTGFAMPSLPANGIGSLEVPVPDLAASEPGRVVTGQGLVYERPHRPRLSSPVEVLVMNQDAVVPDCNGNGIGDFVETIWGGATDANSDLVPDECQYLGPQWYVDASAAPGGDGSQQAPFQTVRAGMEHARAGHEVIVADGVYTGPDNRNLDFLGRDFVVRSADGPAGCILDAEGVGKCFEAYYTETRAAVVRGFTLRDPGSDGMPIDGSGAAAAVRMDFPASLSVEDCIVESRGMLLYAVPDARIRNCAFVGGAGLSIYLGNVQVVESTIDGANGPGVGVTAAASTALFSGTRIRGSSDVGVDIIGNRVGNGQVVFDNCLIANNDSHGIYLLRSAQVHLTNSAIVGNTLDMFTTEGSALFSMTNRDGRDFRLDNTIVWGNSPAAEAITIRGTGTSSLSIERSNLEGGLAAVKYLVAGYPGAFPYVANIAADPLFAELVDYRLGAGSPCIDAGDNTLAPRDTADVDDDGDTLERIPFDYDHRNRYRDDPTVPDTGVGSGPICDIGPHEYRP